MIKLFVINKPEPEIRTSTKEVSDDDEKEFRSEETAELVAGFKMPFLKEDSEHNCLTHCLASSPSTLLTEAFFQIGWPHLQYCPGSTLFSVPGLLHEKG